MEMHSVSSTEMFLGVLWKWFLSQRSLRKHIREFEQVDPGRRLSSTSADTTPSRCPEGAACQPAERKSQRGKQCCASVSSQPSPSFINLQASSPAATFLNIQSTKLPSGVEHKPKECLGLLACMYADRQLQAQLAQQQVAIWENLQASMTLLAPGRGSKKSSLPVLSRNLLLNHLSQFSK
ncbi:unnamed protein product [Nyctereutes procyonoides]|uniref:(raccoon dog) hypothetical protein n=1 Tax=Nyctereutes procyonoides TaxID=34880 RepID=A0A811ZY52_NYCPR|nr:unnamed protein product [Nyctereutes procyonoides]